MNLANPILDSPTLAAWLLLIVVVIYIVSRFLNWRQYYSIHRLKIRVLPKINPWWPAVGHKGYREEDAEYMATVSDPVRKVWKRLVSEGASPHLLNSIKVRQHPKAGKQYSQAHAVWTHEDTDEDGDKEQTEVYLFRNPGGTTDVYAHYEGSVLDPEDHLTGGQSDGDPHGVVRDALGL